MLQIHSYLFHFFFSLPQRLTSKHCITRLHCHMVLGQVHPWGSISRRSEGGRRRGQGFYYLDLVSFRASWVQFSILVLKTTVHVRGFFLQLQLWELLYFCLFQSRSESDFRLWLFLEVLLYFLLLFFLNRALIFVKRSLTKLSFTLFYFEKEES